MGCGLDELEVGGRGLQEVALLAPRDLFQDETPFVTKGSEFDTTPSRRSPERRQVTSPVSDTYR